ISACVSPPQDRVSHMVEVAAIIAQAASTAFPPFWNIIAPAVAASGLPVTAIQWRACSGGFWVRAAPGVAAARHNATARIDARRVVMRGGFSHKVGRNGLTTYRLRGTSVRKLDPVESRK